MNWATMKKQEPQLADLEDQARAAGRSGASWWPTWLALSEPLSKLVGYGAARPELRSTRCYELAHCELLLAWGIDDKPSVAPWDLPGETTPLGPSLLDTQRG